MNVERLISHDYKKLVIDRAPLPKSVCPDIAIREVLRYLYLCSTISASRAMPLYGEIDEYWHELILQTREYAALCNSLPGRRFIHHSSTPPEVYAASIGDDKFVEEKLQWIIDYVRVFGAFEPEASKCWVIVRFLMDRLGLTLDELNMMAASSEDVLRP